MSIIPTSDLERYRQIVASVNVTTERKDEMIAIIFQMMQHFTDMAFGLTDAQIVGAMQQRLTTTESAAPARLTFNSLNGQDDLVTEGANSTSCPNGTGHGHHDAAPGCHLLPS